MKKSLMLTASLCLLVSLASPSIAQAGSWTGEVLDLACYIANGAQGANHTGCAKTCVKNGQPMGLLTDDGTVVLLAADHKNGEAFEAVKELAGQKATVTGELAERDGMKVVTVTGSKAAS